MTIDGQTLLRCEGLAKSFGATRALVDGTIEVAAGEVHVLLGENGAGKSTLAKIIAGVHRPDAGRILVEGREVAIRDVQAARRCGIGIVYQELSLAPHLTVLDNLFLGIEGGPFRLLRRGRERQRAQAVLDRLQISLPMDAVVGRLSVAEKQLLEVAKVLLQDPRIVILDEPTSRLTDREKAFLFETIRRLQRGGVALLYVTHHLREIFELGSRVSAMRSGAVVESRVVDASITEAYLLELLTGRNLSAEVERPWISERQPRLSVSGLVVEGACDGVSFEVNAGEIVGLYGIMGCGRDAIARVLVGLEEARAGEIRLDGSPYRVRSPRDALARGVSYLPGDRKEAGILAQRSVRENFTVSSLSQFARFGVIDGGSEREAVREGLAGLHVLYDNLSQLIASLSGGNQQKVLLGRAIASRPRVLVLDDPTAGIDMGAKLELYRYMRRLAEGGTSIILVSSDLPETLLLCNRIYTVYAGHLVGEYGDTELSDEEAVLADVLGRQTAGSRLAEEIGALGHV